jgi:hypothetical protein
MDHDEAKYLLLLEKIAELENRNRELERLNQILCEDIAELKRAEEALVSSEE